MKVIETTKKAVKLFGESISNQEYLKGTHCKLKELESIHHYLYWQGMTYKQAVIYTKLVYAKIMYNINSKDNSTYDSSVVPF